MPHINKSIDFTVEVFIVYKNKVLLRKHDKFNIWLSVGGHIEPNEDPMEAAVREVKEEVGLEIKLDNRLKPVYEYDNTKELIPPYYLNRNRITKTHEHVTFVYFALSKTSKIVQGIKREESKDCKWFSKEDIGQNTEIIPNVRFYALKAIETMVN